MKRPCLGLPGQPCGRLTEGSRCEPCRLATQRVRERGRDRPSAAARGYDAQYAKNRRVLLARDTRCWICGDDGADTADHVTPVSRGGTSALDNLRPAHRSCNFARGNRPASPDYYAPRRRSSGLDSNGLIPGVREINREW